MVQINTPEDAKKAINEINLRIAAFRESIAKQQVVKSAKRTELNGILDNKRTRLRRLQDEINGTKIPLQKTRRRESRQRESDRFDASIARCRTDIERIDQGILKLREEIEHFNHIKQGIKAKFNL